MDPLVITSVQNDKIKQLVALGRAKTRRETGRTLAEGIHLAQEAFASNCEVETLLVCDTAQDRPEIAALLATAEERGVRVWMLNDACYRKISDLQSPEGVAVVLPVTPHSLRELTHDAQARLLVAGGVQDPGNAGALARVGEAVGVSGCVFLDGIDITHPRFLRASMGSALRVPCVAASSDEFCAELEQSKLRLYIADAADSAEIGPTPQAYDTATYAPPLALCVGGEGQGVSPALRAKAHARIYLPMQGRLESLNVAVAAGVLCYHAARSWN